jgi:ribonucleoside-diphosphate reductase alpha chain
MTLEGAPHLKPTSICRCSTAPTRAAGSASVPVGRQPHPHDGGGQPFISGAISKTINMPNDATVDDCKEAYMLSWKLGAQGQRAVSRRLKAVAAAPPPSSTTMTSRTWIDADRTDNAGQAARGSACREDRRADRRGGPPSGAREAAADRRKGYTQKAIVGGHKVYLRTGEYDDGRIGEIFIDMHKEGAAFRSLMNNFAIASRSACSTACRSRSTSRPSPSRASSRPASCRATTRSRTPPSILDYIFRELAVSYLATTATISTPRQSTLTDGSHLCVRRHGGGAGRLCRGDANRHPRHRLGRQGEVGSRTPRRGPHEGLRRRLVWGVWKLHAAAQRHLHEVRHVWEHQWV